MDIQCHNFPDKRKRTGPDGLRGIIKKVIVEVGVERNERWKKEYVIPRYKRWRPPSGSELQLC